MPQDPRANENWTATRPKIVAALTVMSPNLFHDLVCHVPGFDFPVYRK
jgi:hypothetical protein